MYFVCDTTVFSSVQGWNDLNRLIKISDLNQMIFFVKKNFNHEFD